MRNKLPPPIPLRLIIVPIRDLAAVLGDRFLQRLLGSVPVAAREHVVVEDDSVFHGAPPGRVAGRCWDESWVDLVWGWGGEGDGA